MNSPDEWLHPRASRNGPIRSCRTRGQLTISRKRGPELASVHNPHTPHLGTMASPKIIPRETPRGQRNLPSPDDLSGATLSCLSSPPLSAPPALCLLRVSAVWSMDLKKKLPSCAGSVCNQTAQIRHGDEQNCGVPNSRIRELHQHAGTRARRQTEEPPACPVWWKAACGAGD